MLFFILTILIIIVGLILRIRREYITGDFFVSVGVLVLVILSLSLAVISHDNIARFEIMKEKIKRDDIYYRVYERTFIYHNLFIDDPWIGIFLSEDIADLWEDRPQ